MLSQMLWNWYTIDSCFLAESWHVTTQGAFAATCIGTVLLVVLVEFVRRIAREYDASIRRQFSRQAAASRTGTKIDGLATVVFRASPLQQLIRSVLYAAVVGGAYILMLIAMSFNGYVVICIIIGAGLGKFLCDWLVVKVNLHEPEAVSPGKGTDEAAICCI